MRIAEQDSKRGACALEVFLRLPLRDLVVCGEGLFLVSFCITDVHFRVETRNLTTVPFVVLKPNWPQGALHYSGPGTNPCGACGHFTPLNLRLSSVACYSSPSSFLRAPGAGGRTVSDALSRLLACVRVPYET